MIEKYLKVVNERFKGNLQGDALFIDLEKLYKDFDYAGLWFACDKNPDTSVTSEFYYSDNSEKKPVDFHERITENSFIQNNRYRFLDKSKYVWVGVNIDTVKYSKIKTGVEKIGKCYINYRVYKTSNSGNGVLSGGTLRGGECYFTSLTIGDKNTGASEAILFFILIKGYPPEDWEIDDLCVNVENLPILSQTFNLSYEKKISGWFGQNPLEKINNSFFA
jgi:hypothetical protein